MNSGLAGEQMATILVVDDEPQLRQVIRTQLEEHGYPIVTTDPLMAGVRDALMGSELRTPPTF